MNIKLHTPKSLKMGSGMNSWKQFLLSILATSVSIALTFGTAAIIDNNKKQKEKREIVMMVMYDMYNTMNSVEKADSMLQLSMRIQYQLAEDTTRFGKLKYQMAGLIPRPDYTETTEHIFSSSIETINTVGNVLFTENVAEFYQLRHIFKTSVCDSLTNEFSEKKPLQTIKNTLNMNFWEYVLTNNELLSEMQRLYAECKQMMDVTDEEIEAYREERKQIEEEMSKEQKDRNSVTEKVIQLQKKIDAATEKLQLELESE